MNVLYLSTFDIQGGAAKGAYRLHRGFIRNGITSTMLVQIKDSDDHTVIPNDSTILKQQLGEARGLSSRAIFKLQKKPPTVQSLNILPTNLANYINQSDADIVQLHWIGDNLISIADLARVRKPIVWRLADMWSFCGTEHYVDHQRYIDGYHRHNRPEEYSGLDIDRLVWRRKMKHWQDKPFTIVTGSEWLAQCVSQSMLFKDKRVEVIPSGLDMDVYKPLNKTVAREVLNLPQDKKLILFGAMSATSDKRKGFHLLYPAIQKLALAIEADSTELVVFGASTPKEPIDFDLKTTYLGKLNDDYSLAIAYSAADVFILPALQDNLPYTIIEALACGIPCVAFDIGGMPDMIDHQKNGFLATPFSTDELCHGLTWLLSLDKKAYQDVSHQARHKAESTYDVNLQVQNYLTLYQSILGGTL